MRNAGGYFAAFDVNGQVTEADSFTCDSCNRVTLVYPKQRPEDLGGLCPITHKLICKECVGKGLGPFEERLNQMEASYHARRSYGLE